MQVYIAQNPKSYLEIQNYVVEFEFLTVVVMKSTIL
jgi:hypothetical protein